MVRTVSVVDTGQGVLISEPFLQVPALSCPEHVSEHPQPADNAPGNAVICRAHQDGRRPLEFLGRTTIEINVALSPIDASSLILSVCDVGLSVQWRI